MLARLRLPLLIAAFAALVAMPAAVSAQSAPTPKAATGTSPRGLTRRPKQIVYTPDGSGYFAGAHRHGRGASPIHWSSWGTTAATGTGADWLDNCEPDCAQGHFTAYRATIRLDRPKRLGGQLVFTRLTIKLTGPHPARLSRGLVARLLYLPRTSSYLW